MVLPSCHRDPSNRNPIKLPFEGDGVMHLYASCTAARGCMRGYTVQQGVGVDHATGGGVDHATGGGGVDYATGGGG